MICAMSLKDRSSGPRTATWPGPLQESSSNSLAAVAAMSRVAQVGSLRSPEIGVKNIPRPASSPTAPRPPLKPLSGSEIRVLRYLPTNLSTPEIANELHVSRNTIRTHMSHLYAKLGTHRRTEAVERARALGLLAPLARRR
jgi:DNA-binding NarL/FixJ family response regulator